MTQIEEARKGNLTEAMKAVAEEERVSPERPSLRRNVYLQNL